MSALGAAMDSDGVFGKATEAMVRALQAANGLTADGVVGNATVAALFALSAAPVDSGNLPGDYLGHYEAYDGGRSLGTVDVVEIDGVKVGGKTAQAWMDLKAAAAADGVTLKLNSGFRTMDEQAMESDSRLRLPQGDIAAADPDPDIDSSLEPQEAPSACSSCGAELAWRLHPFLCDACD